MSETERVLVKSVNWIGDTVLSTCALHWLRQLRPEAHITVLARPWVAPLLEDNQDIDEVWVEDEQPRVGNLPRVGKLILCMRSRKFDVGVLFPNSFSAALLMRAGAVRERIGYATDGRGFLLTRPVELTQDLLNVHQIEYYLYILRPLGEVDPAPRKIFLTVPLEVREQTREQLQQLGLNPQLPIIALNPGATFGPAKRWFPQRFAAVGDELARRYRAQIAITGSLRERGIAQEVARLMHSRCTVVAGQLSLRHFMAFLSLCRLFVTNDSGAMHMAAGLGTPLVAIFGSTNPITTGPFSDRAVVVRKPVECAPCLKRECPTDFRCMELITVAEVLAAAERLLAPAPPH